MTWLWRYFESILCLLSCHDYEIVASKEVKRYRYGENVKRTLFTYVCLRPGCHAVWDEIGDYEEQEKDRSQRLAKRKEEALKKHEAILKGNT